jgi:hypothetical protein
MKNSRAKSRTIALAAVFAALYFVLRSLPNPIPFLFQMIGISGRLTTGDFLLTTVALFAGLWGGVLAVFVGTVLAYPINAPVFLGLDFIPGVVNVFITGLVLGHRLKIARVVYIAILLLFISSPYSLLFGSGYVPYVWLHIVALVVLLSPIMKRAQDWVVRNDAPQIIAIAALAFVGTMSQHLTGGLLYEVVVGLVQGNSTTVLRENWQIIFWLYPAERLLLTGISTIVSMGVLRSVRTLRT